MCMKVQPLSLIGEQKISKISSLGENHSRKKAKKENIHNEVYLRTKCWIGSHDNDMGWTSLNWVPEGWSAACCCIWGMVTVTERLKRFGFTLQQKDVSFPFFVSLFNIIFELNFCLISEIEKWIQMVITAVNMLFLIIEMLTNCGAQSTSWFPTVHIQGW